jgi:NO-binding membrane sensor protein with MHYT domain
MRQTAQGHVAESRGEPVEDGMGFLDVSHNPVLVLASLCVALIAGFTGLSLTYGLADKTDIHRKVSITLAAIALGGGIWSMHFVAMLGLQLPVLFYFDAVITLISALVAILVVGCALLILHYRPRTPGSVTLAGSFVGLGILAMHYIGMSGLELCRTVYSLPGIALATLSSIGLSVLAFRAAYGRREHRNILIGTACFGISVFAVHFIAIAGTRFQAIETASTIGPPMSKEVLAVGVVLSSFVLCGAFLLSGVTFLTPPVSGIRQPVPVPQPEDGADRRQTRPAPQPVPYEQAGRTFFMDADAIAAVQAEGHYTYLYTRTEKLFCAWTITEAEKRLLPHGFIRSHRSFLVNPLHVSSFERLKDSGLCHFDSVAHLTKAPISRSHLPSLREALGL